MMSCIEAFNGSVGRRAAAGVLAMMTGVVVSHSAAAQAARTPESHLLARARQMIVVITPEWDSTAGTLRRFERVHGHWRARGETVPIVVGRTGLAWGVGLDGDGPHKVEGDGRSPAGVFPLDTAFGFAPVDSMQMHVPYVPLTESSDCVDDTASAHYNTVVDRRTTTPVDWSSAEHMRRVAQYRLGVIVGYNAPRPVKGRGSCIFLHIWAGPRSTTVGCTAMDADVLRRLMLWLDPRRHPVLVQLPRAEYERLRARWRLPPP